MPISPADDLLAHQTTETFDYVFTSDRNFYDRHYFNMHASSDALFLVTGMGQYPNLGVTDALCRSRTATRSMWCGLPGSSVPIASTRPSARSASRSWRA